ncbi:RNA polymerase sigma factor [Bacteroides sp. OttesenSCG-928-J23]|nr:RNA polymerase sigma factor [Bacteroides sp. OttesenSCG-928-J23]MDL2304983.1 RNA polymerase sigma factor [Bacteroides sp. OttesenSCG-928-D19]
MNKKSKNTSAQLKVNKETVSTFFTESREPFIGYLLRHYTSLRREDAEDLYQESFIALHQNILSGKLTELTSSLYTYLLRIGINKTNDRLKLSGSKQTCQLEEHLWSMDEKIAQMEFIEDESPETEKIVYELIEKMESPCKEILFGYYYDKYNMEELALRLGYRDASVAKASKYRCMQKIKNIIKKLFNII